MTARREASGIALRCDRHGVIREVLRDDVDITPRPAVGLPFALVADGPCRAKAARFVDAIGERGPVFDWELNFRGDGAAVVLLRFAGVAVGDDLMIAGAATSEEMEQLYESLTASEGANRPTDLVSLLRHAVEVNGMLAAGKRIGLALRCDEPSIVLPVDAAKIEQLLANLIGNAVKFSRPDTSVHVDLERRGEEIVLSVTDRGQGIPEAERTRLFRPFQCTSVKPTHGERSTGLGLAIAAKIVAAHGGRIWVESEVGRGSTFRVSLPVRPRSPETGRVVAKPTSLCRRLEILVAEDSQPNQQLVQRLLERRGHSVTIADDGCAALRALAVKNFDVILMDVEMPGVDGIQVTSAIRAAEAASGGHVPIVGVTAHTGPEGAERCLAAGMDACLHKPLDVKQLNCVIEEALRKSRLSGC